MFLRYYTSFSRSSTENLGGKQMFAAIIEKDTEWNCDEAWERKNFKAMRKKINKTR